MSGVDVEKKLRAAGIGRFQVMALLQAARHYILYGDKDKAKSFGLNRAVFYAWAKHYGPRRTPFRSIKIEDLEKLYKKEAVRGRGKTRCPEGFVEVAGECVQVGPRGYYMIGEQEQEPVDFDRQVSSKLRIFFDPEKVWETAVEYVKQFPRKILEDPQKFYKIVYEPVRDTFFKQILLGEKPKPRKELINRLTALEEMVEKTKTKQKSLIEYTSSQKGEEK